MGHYLPVNIPLHSVAETPIYLARAEKLMSEAERNAVIDLLAASPDVGDLIPGTGGLRKVRVPLAGRGKRGGARVIYYFYNDSLPVYLLLAYAKNEQDNFSPEQMAVLKRFVETVTAQRRR